MSAVVLAASGLSDAARQLEDGILRVASLDTDEVKALHERLSLMREWAKFQADAEALVERIVWLEACILRRIAVLGEEKQVLPAAHRRAARHFATLDEGELGLLLNNFPARTAVASFNLWMRDQEHGRARQRGRSRALGRVLADSVDSPYGEDDLTPAWALRVGTVRAAAALIVDDLSTWRPFTVDEAAQDFIEENIAGIDHDSLVSDGFRKGVREAIRHALCTAPVQGDDSGALLPAFLTTYDAETDQWFRIASQFARVSDAENMLSLRRAQVETMSRAVAELEQKLGLFMVNKSPQDWLLNGPAAEAARRAAVEEVAS